MSCLLNQSIVNKSSVLLTRWLRDSITPNVGLMWICPYWLALATSPWQQHLHHGNDRSITQKKQKKQQQSDEPVIISIMTVIIRIMNRPLISVIFLSFREHVFSTFCSNCWTILRWYYSSTAVLRCHLYYNASTTEASEAGV